MASEYVYIDIETDGLKPTTIWCAVCRYRGINTVCLNGDDFRAFLQSINNPVLVFHNGILFDLPVLKSIWGFDSARMPVVDTLVLSRLANPSRDSGHSLRAWGERLGFPKGDHEDWRCLTPEMIRYCERDTEVTEAVHKAVLKELDGFSQESIDLEHQVAWIIAEQERNGWLLDERKAHILAATYTQEMKQIETDLQEVFPPIVTERFSEKQFDKVTGLPKKLKPRVEVFNPGSRQQVAKRLEAKGAVWEKRTETGRPMVDEQSLKDNEQIPEAALVLRYLLVQKKLGQVNNWLKHVENDSRVRGRVITNGAVTGRMTHQSPNMAQVDADPKCRSCWIVPPGKKLVGGDASGLELRMLAHYMADPEYTKELLNGDIHTKHQIAAGLQTRPQAKTFIYAFLYGAGDAKIGSIVGGTNRDGAELKQRFLRNIPALESLRTRVSKAAKRGYLVGLDGRRILVRSEHAALNTLLQGAGAVIMKQALVFLHKKATDKGLDFKLVGNIHDEIQAEVNEKHSEAFGELIVQAIVEAGQHFNLRCPLDGEYKIGKNWSETH